MYFRNGSDAVGTRSLSIVITGALVLLASIATAETIATINGMKIDSSVLEVYTESRTQRPMSQLAEQDRQKFVSELVDLYVLSTQPGADELRQDQRIAAQIQLQERAIVAQAFATNYIAANAATDDEILAEYDVQVKGTPPLQFKARHILVASQGEAIDLIAKLDSGSDFVTLAAEFSTGPSAKDGGALPWFSPSQMVKPFSDAVALLEDGEYTSAPVQTEFGWHVILREESRANEPPPLESIREDIKQNVAQMKFQAYLEQLRTDATSAD